MERFTSERGIGFGRDGDRPPGEPADQEITTQRMTSEERDARLPGNSVPNYLSRKKIIEAERVPPGAEIPYFETGLIDLKVTDNILTRRLRIEGPPEE